MGNATVSAPDAEDVKRVLEEVLASPPFCHTQQCQNLLTYIVKHSLKHEDHLLRERVIGAEVFGRKPDYEPGEDPVVRIRAAEIRKRLAQFYQSFPGSTEGPKVQIDIPSGSYRASFRWRDSEPRVGPPDDTRVASHVASVGGLLPLSPMEVQPSTTPRQSRSPVFKRLWLMGIIAILILAGVFAVRKLRSSPALAYDQFWQPWTQSSKPVIIAVGSNAVYRLSNRLTDRYAKDHNIQDLGMEFFVPLDATSTLSGNDLEPAPASFVALGDVAAVSNLVATLTGKGQRFQERFPNDISFAELRNTPTILVGGFNNPMTIELTKHTPFVLSARNEIDETDGAHRKWVLRASGDSHDTEDYAILTRMVPINGDSPILSVAGMGQYGTQAAANLVSDAQAVASLVRTLPSAWQYKSLQVVLHIRVIDFKASSTSVVAARLW